jgi:hypothetical protein
MWGVAPASAIPGPRFDDVGTKLTSQSPTSQKPSARLDITHQLSTGQGTILLGYAHGAAGEKKKNEDEICTSSISPSTIPLTSGIEEAPQLLLSVTIFLPHNQFFRNTPFCFFPGAKLILAN